MVTTRLAYLLVLELGLLLSTRAAADPQSDLARAAKDVAIDKLFTLAAESAAVEIERGPLPPTGTPRSDWFFTNLAVLYKEAGVSAPQKLQKKAGGYEAQVLEAVVAVKTIQLEVIANFLLDRLGKTLPVLSRVLKTGAGVLGIALDTIAPTATAQFDDFSHCESQSAKSPEKAAYIETLLGTTPPADFLKYLATHKSRNNGKGCARAMVEHLK